VEYVFRKPTGSAADRGAAPPRYRLQDGPLYLEAGSGTLSHSRPAAASVSYDSERAGNGRARATFDLARPAR
jgi:hypothetical protein